MTPLLLFPPPPHTQKLRVQHTRTNTLLSLHTVAPVCGAAAVLSAVSGLKVAIPSLQQGEVIGITIVVLVLLFSVQYMGTAKISAVFAPIIAVWLLFNAGIGFANLSMNGWGVWKVRPKTHKQQQQHLACTL